MPLPIPEPGLVISYSYLWQREHYAGKEEGRKTRPCVIVLAVEQSGTDAIVTIAPVTHSPPANPAYAVEIPTKVKRSLDLDDQRSWVILNEVNQFTWPGFDLQPIPGNDSRYEYGFLPPRLFDKIRLGILDLFMRHRAGIVRRD